MSALPPHVRRDLESAATLRALRRLLDARPEAVGLVIARNVPAPDDILRAPLGEVHVGAVSPERARELAVVRSEVAAGRLDHAPDEAHAGTTHWCLYLDAGGRCAVVPVTVGANARSGGAPPRTPEAA